MCPLLRITYTFWLTLSVLRPASVRNCTSEMCDVHWRVSPWRMCTVTCGSGFQSRRVECVHRHNNKTLPDLYCTWQRRPVTWQHCNITSCGSMLMFFFISISVDLKCLAVLDPLLWSDYVLSHTGSSRYHFWPEPWTLNRWDTIWFEFDAGRINM